MTNAIYPDTPLHDMASKHISEAERESGITYLNERIASLDAASEEADIRLKGLRENLESR